MLSDATRAYAEEVTSALLGADTLFHPADLASDDRLYVVDMVPNPHPAAFGDFAEARARFGELQEAAAVLPEPDRQLYYRQLCGSTLALLEHREHPLPLQAQIERFLHVPADPASEAQLQEMRQEMRSLLSTMGFAGSLEQQCAAWEQRVVVAPAEVEAVLTDLLDQAWDRTAALVEIPAPKSDGMRVATITGVPFNARCDYLRRTIELNVDPILTYPALKHLAVHEGYPGHYLQFKLREHGYRQGWAAADGLLSLVNSASSCTFEGIADYGLYLIGWVDTDDDRLQAVLNRYHAGLGTAAAWRLHGQGWSESQVEEWLRQWALTGGDGWVANRLGFLKAPQRSALITSYWQGEPSVAAAWARVSPSRRDDFIRFVYGRMHSPQSILLFD